MGSSPAKRTIRLVPAAGVGEEGIHLSFVTHYFYLARCADGSLYAGTCLDLEERERKHNDGTGAKYTRGRGPVRILYYEVFRSLNEARKREAEVKKLSKERKEKLLEFSGLI